MKIPLKMLCLVLAIATLLSVGLSEQAGSTPAPEQPVLEDAQATLMPLGEDAQITTDTMQQASVSELPTVPPLETLEPRRLTGVKIGIDPGHQGKGNSQQEAVAPGSSEMKAKVSSGTSGRASGVDEYVVNLDISLQLRDALEELGCEVYMTRETADVDISNQERAIMMNDLGVDLVLRIHCNGSTNQEANGMGLYIRKTGTGADECLRAAEALLPAMLEATGAREDGIFRRDSYTGLNWSEVPCILVEMGFMSNKEEDLKLNDAEYQKKLVDGMVEGVCAFMDR